MSPSRKPLRATKRTLPYTGRGNDGHFVNVLIVAHRLATRRTLNQWFTLRGYFVAIAEDLESAESMQHTLRFDLFVTDASARSHRARRWIEQAMIAPSSPTIFLSTHPSVETAIRIANQPLAGYLADPVDLLALERLVSRFERQCMTSAQPMA